MTAVYVVLLGIFAILSVKSLAVLGTRSPWTSLGWLATVAYCGLAADELLRHEHLAWNLPYWCLGVLTVAFVVAGVRREAQADPWWWPVRTKP